MNKRKFIIVILAALIISIGVINFNYNKNSVITSANLARKQKIQQKSWKERLGIDDAEMAKIIAEGEKLGLTETAKEVILKESESMCQYDALDGAQRVKVTAYIEGEKYRTDFILDNRRNSSVFTGETIYSWIDGEVIGTKISLNCLKELKQRGEDIDPFNSEELNIDEDVEDGNFPDIFEEAIGIRCEKTEKIDLTIPSEVEFIDQCEFLKEQQDLIKELENNK